MLDLPNVKEASTFPRDMHRIDGLLSESAGLKGTGSGHKS
jgi:hypothetical protein